ARTKAQASRHPLRVAYGMPNLLQLRLMRCIHLQVSQYCEVVSGAQTIQMRAQVLPNIAATDRAGVPCIGEQFDSCLLENRLFLGKRACLLVLARKLPSLNLTGLNIGLVEWVDCQDRAGNGRSDFPTEELLAEVVDVVDRNADNGMAGIFKSCDLFVLRCIRRPFKSQVRE